MNSLVCLCYLFLSYSPPSAPYAQTRRAGIHAEIRRGAWQYGLEASYQEVERDIRKIDADLWVFRRVGRAWVGIRHLSYIPLFSMTDDGAGANSIEIRFYWRDNP